MLRPFSCEGGNRPTVVSDGKTQEFSTKPLRLGRVQTLECKSAALPVF